MSPKNDGLTEIEKIVEQEVKKQFVEIRIKMLSALTELANDARFTHAITDKLFDSIEFWETLAKKHAERVKDEIGKHDITCTYRTDHNKYHLENETKWGILKLITNNAIKIILIMLVIFIVIITFLVGSKETVELLKYLFKLII